MLHESSRPPPFSRTLSVCPSSCSPSQARAASAPSCVLKVMKAMPLLGCVCVCACTGSSSGCVSTPGAQAGRARLLTLLLLEQSGPVCWRHTGIAPVCLHLPSHHHLHVQPPMLLAAASRAPPSPLPLSSLPPALLLPLHPPTHLNRPVSGKVITSSSCTSPHQPQYSSTCSRL